MDRGHRELLDGRLCRPDSEQRPLVRNSTTVAIVKLCCHNFTQIANFMIFLCLVFLMDLLTYSYKMIFKKCQFFKYYNLPSESAVQKLSMSTAYYAKQHCRLMHFSNIFLSSENLVCLFVSLCGWQIRCYDDVCTQQCKKEVVDTANILLVKKSNFSLSFISHLLSMHFQYILKKYWQSMDV